VVRVPGGISAGCDAVEGRGGPRGVRLPQDAPTYGARVLVRAPSRLGRGPELLSEEEEEEDRPGGWCEAPRRRARTHGLEHLMFDSEEEELPLPSRHRPEHREARDHHPRQEPRDYVERRPHRHYYHGSRDDYEPHSGSTPASSTPARGPGPGHGSTLYAPTVNNQVTVTLAVVVCYNDCIFPARVYFYHAVPYFLK
jgi:hypothetical protein